jgi:hypothetical protein
MERQKVFADATPWNPDSGSDYEAERRLWTAVLLQAIEDWLSKNMRAYEAANAFLFHGGEDFARVCHGAGIDPSALQSKLRRRCAVPPMSKRHDLRLSA